MPHDRRSTIRLAAVLLLLVLVGLSAGCVRRSADGYRLLDRGSITEYARLDHASDPSGFPGLPAFAYSEGTAGDETMNVRLYDLKSGESTGSVRGLNPALCADGLYYYLDGALWVVAADGTGTPVNTGISGYSLVEASPGNKYLLLANAPVGNDVTRLAINSPDGGGTLPLAWSEERSPAHPRWVTDDTLVVDAVAPEDSSADRAIYQLEISESAVVTATILKNAAQSPAMNEDGLLACLEVLPGDAKFALTVYDVAARERVAVLEADSQSTYGALIWVAQDTLAIEVDTQGEGTNIVLYKVER